MTDILQIDMSSTPTPPSDETSTITFHTNDTIEEKDGMDIPAANMKPLRPSFEASTSTLLPALTKLVETCPSALKEYYIHTLEIVRGWVEVDLMRTGKGKGSGRGLEAPLLGADEEQAPAVTEHPSNAVEISLKLAWLMTLLLIGIKLSTAIYSTSIAMISMAVDSALDVASQTIVAFTQRKIRQRDPHRYPAGKTRLEPLSLIIFAVIMGMSAVILLTEAIRVLIDGMTTPPEIRADAITFTLWGVTLFLQILSYIYCRHVANKYAALEGASSLGVVAEDHLNDVLVNLVGGLPGLMAGVYSSAWLADPIGAIVLSIYIGYRWTACCYEQYGPLAGRTAPSEVISKLSYMAMKHDSRILYVDTV